MTDQKTFQNKYGARALRPLLLAGVLAFTIQTGAAAGIPCAAASARKSPTTLENVISRVDKTTKSGLVRSYFEDADGALYTDSSAETANSSAGSSLKKSAALPSRYDLREHSLTTSIKDQGDTGCCWAFSAIKTIESNCIKNGLFSADSVDFSENHLAWFSYHPSTVSSDATYWDGIHSAGNDASLSNPFSAGAASTTPYDNGGSAILATFTLAKWAGADLESNTPFSGDNPSAISAMASAMTQKDAYRYNSYAHLQNVYNFDEYTIGSDYYFKDTSVISEMKQAILDYGAMSASLYYDKSFLRSTALGTSYYQTEYTGANAVKNANHSVTIVGWDDSFSASSFARTPSGNGAWLIANSYGTEVGDQGYFWLSYYDNSICDCTSFLMESLDNYDHIYQYDGFGWGTANYSDSQNIKVANIFEAGSTTQQLSAVSFYTLTDNQAYRVQVYRQVGSTPTDGVLIDACTTEGTAVQNGYHTVSLKTPVTLRAGEHFSVLVTYIQTGDTTVYAPLEGWGSDSSSMNISYGSRTGESFLFTKKKASASASSTRWYDSSALDCNNVCVKAFTNDTSEAADPLPTVKKTITLGRGETWQIPGDYTSYVSNDSALLSVSDSGKVKARKRGTTSVRVSDGSSEYLYRFKIKKAPSRVKITPARKKTMKKGSTLTLRTSFPSGAACRTVTYHSSRPRIAKISKNGKITARRCGKTTITVKTYNGRKARLKVTVQKK